MTWRELRALGLILLPLLLAGLLVLGASTAWAAEDTPSPSPSPTAEPTVEPTVEPTTEPTTEPTAEPTAEPVCGSVELPCVVDLGESSWSALGPALLALLLVQSAALALALRR